MKQLSIAVLALLAAGCATDSERYGGYDYGHSDGYYVVDEVVYGGSAGYGSIGLGYDPYWGSSGFAYYERWPSYYVWAPYYDPYYVSGYGFGLPDYYWPGRRGWSGFGYGYSDPWYFGYYDHYGYGRYRDRGHHGHRNDRYRDRRHVGDDRGGRYRGRGQDPGRSARNEAVRLSTSRQPISRTPPKGPRAGRAVTTRVPTSTPRGVSRPDGRANQPVLRPNYSATPRSTEPARPGVRSAATTPRLARPVLNTNRGSMPSASRPISRRPAIGDPAEGNAQARRIVSRPTPTSARPMPPSRPSAAAVPVRSTQFSKPIATTRVIARDQARRPSSAIPRNASRSYSPTPAVRAPKPDYRGVPQVQTPRASQSEDTPRASPRSSGNRPESNPRGGKKRR